MFVCVLPCYHLARNETNMPIKGNSVSSCPFNMVVYQNESFLQWISNCDQIDDQFSQKRQLSQFSSV
jgi:hypothetical protein